MGWRCYSCAFGVLDYVGGFDCIDRIYLRIKIGFCSPVIKSFHGTELQGQNDDRPNYDTFT